MAKLEQYSKRIADYIYNDMDLKERHAFEEDLERDKELEQEYHFQLKMADHLKAKSEIENFTDESDMAEAERFVMEHKEKHPEDFVVTEEDRRKHKVIISIPVKAGRLRQLVYPLLAAAAVFVGLIVIKNVQTGNQGSRLYGKYYHPMNEVGFVTRGMDEQDYFNFNNAMDQYRDGKYSSASLLLFEISEKQPEHEEAVFFLGLSKMGEESFQEATDILTVYLADFDKYHFEASWYLALCYLRLDQPDSARILLQGLTSIDGDFGSNATKLLTKLD